MHARNNAAQIGELAGPASPPATTEGFAQMTYAQRVDLHGRNAALYRQLADQEKAAAGQVTR